MRQEHSWREIKGCGDVYDMMEGPSRSTGRSRSQTILSGCILRNRVVSVRKKAGASQSCVTHRGERKQNTVVKYRNAQNRVEIGDLRLFPRQGGEVTTIPEPLAGGTEVSRL